MFALSVTGRISHVQKIQFQADSGLEVCLANGGTSYPGKLWATTVFEGADNVASC